MSDAKTDAVEMVNAVPEGRPLTVVVRKDGTRLNYTSYEDFYDEVVKLKFPEMTFEEFQESIGSPILSHAVGADFEQPGYLDTLRSVAERYESVADDFASIKQTRRDVVLMALRDGEDAFEVLKAVGVPGVHVLKWLNASSVVTSKLQHAITAADERIKNDKRVFAYLGRKNKKKEADAS